ncbi:Peptidase C14 caspase domain-containing protein [Pleurotus pulmonarius]
MDSGSPRKRALLIGIEYIRSRNPELGRLQGPAEEADDLASLLESHYDYYPEDIVILTDKDKNFLRRPTRDNILREIDDLVADVEPGDQILFHYSGHCGQYPRLDGTEEDNLDEAIEALDGPILDDILKERLVDPLPAGSTLVAILDTCHSETLLDLPHYHCNRVHVPLTYTGTSEDDYTTPNWRPRRLKGMKPPRRELPTRSAKSADSTCMNMKAKSLSIRIPRGTSPAVLNDDMQCYSPGSEITFTASPMQEHHHHCPPTPGLNDLKPTVIAISAAKDSQASYWSITKIIVDILRKHRELPLEDLITQVSYEMYKETQREIKRHKWHPENEHHKPQYSHPSVCRPVLNL